MVEFHLEGLNELVADLDGAPLEVRRQVRPIVQKGCHNIKTDAQRLASGLAHAPLYPQSITYDTTEDRAGEVVGEVGPDKDRPQGALGNILEYGTSKNAPFAHLGPAFDLEQPRFIEAIENLGEQTLA